MSVKSAIRRLVRFVAQKANTGCSITIFVAALLLYVGLKISAAHRSNARLINAAEAIAGRAPFESAEAIQEQILAAASSLDIQEALNYHAVSVARSVGPAAEEGRARNGMCIVRIKYTRKIGIFFDMAEISLVTDREIAKPFLLTQP